MNNTNEFLKEQKRLAVELTTMIQTRYIWEEKETD